MISIDGRLRERLSYLARPTYVARVTLPPVDAPLAARIVAGVVGLALLVRGAALYRLAVIAPGMLAGVAVAVEGGRRLALEPQVVAAGAVVLAVAGGVLCHVAERVAVYAAGMLVGGAVAIAADAPWWGLLIGVSAGAVAFPMLYARALPVLTAALGAVAVAWASGLSSLPVVVGLVLLGSMIQFAFSAPTRK